VSCRRRNHAYQIDIVPGDKVFPIIGYMFNTKLLRTFRAFTMPARDGDDPRPRAILEAGNLRGAGKAGANDPNADSFIVTQSLQASLPILVA
jgi:hypothetical protein